MNEHEQKLRAYLDNMRGDNAHHVAELERLLKSALVEARSIAVEDAAREGKSAVLAWFIGKGPDSNADGYVAERIRAVGPTPPTRYLSEVEVQNAGRKMLAAREKDRSGYGTGWSDATHGYASFLGVKLDAAPAQKGPTT